MYNAAKFYDTIRPYKILITANRDEIRTNNPSLSQFFSSKDEIYDGICDEDKKEMDEYVAEMCLLKHESLFKLLGGLPLDTSKTDKINRNGTCFEN